MKDKIKTLLELQKLDTQIADIQKTIKEVPDTIISLTNKIEFDERKINNLNEKIAGSNKEIKVLQNETLDIDQKISQLEDKLFLIKSSKEFEALQKETGDLKRKKIDVEDNQLKIMEEIQSLTKNSELLQSKFDEELSPVKEEIKKLESELKGSESEIEVIKNDIHIKVKIGGDYHHWNIDIKRLSESGSAGGIIVGKTFLSHILSDLKPGTYTICVGAADSENRLLGPLDCRSEIVIELFDLEWKIFSSDLDVGFPNA